MNKYVSYIFFILLIISNELFSQEQKRLGIAKQRSSIKLQDKPFSKFLPISIEKGDTLEIYIESDNSYKIFYKNKYGWINKSKVKEIEIVQKFTPFNTDPVPINNIKPIYPRVAQVAGIEGRVVIRAFIDEYGAVYQAEVLQGKPKTGLDEAALEAVKNTKFKPAKQRGKHTAVWYDIPIDFSFSGRSFGPLVVDTSLPQKDPRITPEQEALIIARKKSEQRAKEEAEHREKIERSMKKMREERAEEENKTIQKPIENDPPITTATVNTEIVSSSALDRKIADMSTEEMDANKKWLYENRPDQYEEIYEDEFPSTSESKKQETEEVLTDKQMETVNKGSKRERIRERVKRNLSRIGI